MCNRNTPERSQWLLHRRKLFRYGDYGRVARQNEAAGAADASAFPKHAASEIRDKQSTLERENRGAKIAA